MRCAFSVVLSTHELLGSLPQLISDGSSSRATMVDAFRAISCVGGEAALLSLFSDACARGSAERTPELDPETVLILSIREPSHSENEHHERSQKIKRTPSDRHALLICESSNWEAKTQVVPVNTVLLER